MAAGSVRLAAADGLVRAVQGWRRWSSDNPPTSWFYDLLRNSRLVDGWHRRVWRPLSERLDGWLIRRLPPLGMPGAQEGRPSASDRRVAGRAGGRSARRRLLRGRDAAAAVAGRVGPDRLSACWRRCARVIAAWSSPWRWTDPGGRPHRHQRAPGALAAAGRAGDRLDPGHGALSRSSCWAWSALRAAAWSSRRSC